MTTESEIVSLEERLRAAQLASDTDELSALIDDTLTFVGLDGSIVNKADDLNLHKSTDFRITKMNVVERSIQCYEGVAIVNVIMDAAAEINGVNQSDKIRYLRVWHQFADGWRIISGGMRLV